MKVCQHVWRETVLTDSVQVFSLTRIPQTDRVTVWKMQIKKEKNSPFSLFSHFGVVLYDLQRRGVHMTAAVCVHKAKWNSSMFYPTYIIYLSSPGSHLVLSLSNMRHSTSPNHSLSCTTELLIFKPKRESLRCPPQIFPWARIQTTYLRHLSHSWQFGGLR